MAYTVYMLTLPNKKKYIGMTGRELEERWQKGNGYTKNEKLYRDIKLSGWDNVEKTILENTESKTRARKIEFEKIVEHNSYKIDHGYNYRCGFGGLYVEGKKVVNLSLYEDDKYIIELIAEKQKKTPKQFVESLLMEYEYKSEGGFVRVGNKRYEELLSKEKSYNDYKDVIRMIKRQCERIDDRNG